MGKVPAWGREGGKLGGGETLLAPIATALENESLDLADWDDRFVEICGREYQDAKDRREASPNVPDTLLQRIKMFAWRKRNFKRENMPWTTEYGWRYTGEYSGKENKEIAGNLLMLYERTLEKYITTTENARRLWGSYEKVEPSQLEAEVNELTEMSQLLPGILRGYVSRTKTLFMLFNSEVSDCLDYRLSQRLGIAILL